MFLYSPPPPHPPHRTVFVTNPSFLPDRKTERRQGQKDTLDSVSVSDSVKGVDICHHHSGTDHSKPNTPEI